MIISAIKMKESSKINVYSRDVDSATGNERIYNKVKDGHKEEDQQSIQHLGREELTFKWLNKTKENLIKA